MLVKQCLEFATAIGVERRNGFAVANEAFDTP